MKRHTDVLIIGAGSAGLAAALALKEEGVSDLLIVDREAYPGGILLQCIHNGFGLHRFGEELTGPEYAQRYVDTCLDRQVEILSECSVVDIIDNTSTKCVMILSVEHGLVEVTAKAIVLAMGCRERNRGNINIPGSRPAGVMTAGLAQKLVNMEGYLPGSDIVMVGSGDIGLIMARRMTLEGARIRAVLEKQPYPAGLQRNIVQCLNDYDIPLYISHAITAIHGNKRVEAVDIAEISETGQFTHKTTMSCDTVLLSVGLIPENELSQLAGVALHPVTGGPIVNSHYMTNVQGIFACGNVLHVHDLVDYVSEEATACGVAVSQFIRDHEHDRDDVRISCGNMVRYVVPMSVQKNKPAILRLRCVAPVENVTLSIRSDGRTVHSKKFRHITPSEMLVADITEVPPRSDNLFVSFEV